MATWRIGGAAILIFFSTVAALRAEPNADTAKTLARLQLEKLEAARKTYQLTWKNYREGRRVSEDTLYRWSMRWLEAEKQLAERPEDRVAACRGHFERMREIEKLIGDLRRAGQSTVDEVSATEFYRAEAEIWLIQARSEKKEP
jgi:hypothetical protein